MNEIKPDIDVDWERVLNEDREEKYHQFYLDEGDMQIIIRSLMGKEPRDEYERGSREVLINGLVWQLTGEQEVEA